ncbi:hypothetical protein DS745_18490 [Anaerobacillus alkaliphilus]|uniref:Intracellular proteinase inhibitor BsuPI domain-containing protein n=1 Tax=Anaerobacillus alkaliphilus TaxID=1548597 RepID=A0A4Q0VQW4_9BACI|nr:BsuPI-related putative proteinase inhibitor [Anaerobacillus alkaliphilus]RXI98317.1 hypothetical protein DS745_18490 [Anaerobacillus alkaliphilus]
MAYLEKKTSLLAFICMFSLLVGCGTNERSIEYSVGGNDNMTSILNVMKVGNVMRFKLSLTNETDEKVFLQFPSGQQFEIIVKDQSSNVVYKYSEGKMFTMAIVTREMAPGETLVWEDEWNEAVPGTYVITGELQIISVNGESVDRNQFITKKTINWEK